MEVPTDLKYIAPFIQRGQELATRDPIVSYYAQYYAAKLAMAKGPRTKETKEYLFHLLDALEEQKKTIGDNEAITNDLVGYAHVENFALKIFLNADNEDRAGKASKKTAKTFLAASIFLELLKTFGDLDPEVEAKIKYAKWKATDIMKALREGRVPTAGPPGEEQEAFDAPPISEFPSPPSNFTAPLPSTSPQQGDMNDRTSDVDMPAAATATATATATTTSTSTSTSTAPQIAVNTASINIPQAQKNAKWAISALDYDDIKTARMQLLSALNEIGFNQNNNFGF
ncbi:Vta1 like-domain-containing protein [Gilbertella persicaria]|uniref:Vta1 like-domain-containing protein n=1 Tax=Gilbertella persicaria TaxID=101096 RepID=UPI00221E6AD2|nr:Vta1 like-domain-containing protein [Gilbertella persicaria]KAI8062837.1 Vta1 like-domain-containing protein [Gilbertella persicaria]